MLNDEYPREQQQNGTPNQGQGLTIGFTKADLENALKKMRKNKATGPDEIPVEAWRVLGGEEMDLLWDLMIKIYEQEHIPDEWRESVLVPIYKEKGDVQECQNYRGKKGIKPNTRIRGTVKVAELSKKVQEARLRWYGHILRRDEEGVERRMMDMEVQGCRGRGRPKTRWKDCIAADVQEKQLDVEMVHKGNDWQQLIINSDPL